VENDEAAGEVDFAEKTEGLGGEFGNHKSKISNR
jgi:hypothetical protein